MKPRMLRANPRIIEPCGYAVCFRDLSIIILQKIGLVPVQNTRGTAGKARGMPGSIKPFARRLDTDDFDTFIIEKGMKKTDGIGTTADGRDQHVWQTSLSLQYLLTGFTADHLLKVADKFRIGMGTRDGADDVKSVMHIRDQIAQRFVHRILERAGSRLNGADQIGRAHV